MLFNKDNKGASELRELTGNYFASNDFSKVKGEIDAATDELKALVGDAIVLLADTAYNNNQSDELVRLVRRPIALIATLRMYRKNDLSHEDDGRKFKVATDNSEKLPWEWQLDRDDAIHLDDYYKSIDVLVRYLNVNNIAEWKDSSLYKLSQTLIIRNGASFDRYFPIDRSERIYLLMLPFIREVQTLTVKRAYGSGWDDLLKESDDPETDKHFAACKAVALLAMSLALRRTPLSLIPGGVIRRFIAESGMNESEPASLQDIERVARWMADDGAIWVDEMKKARDGNVIPDYELIPKNDPKNKYFRV